MSTDPGQDAAAVFDLTTPPAALAEIAGRRRDLWSAIKGHPNVYPGLLDWIAQAEAVPVDASLQPLPSAPGLSARERRRAERAEGGAPVAGPTRSRRGWIIALIVLLLGAIGGGIYLLVELQRTQTQLDDAEQLNDERQRQIDEQLGELEDRQQQLDEQQEMLDEKETFGAAMEDLLSKARQLDGAPTASIIPFEDYEDIATEAWESRDSPDSVRSLTETVQDYAAELDTVLETAGAELASNASGTLGESLVDAMGAGLVTVQFDANDTSLCGGEASGCVSSADPTIVHLNPTDYFAEYYDDWLRTILTYHEFAHVLQFTNPVPTDAALSSFGGDVEFMADCYALTLTDSWTLDRRVWVDEYRYWDVWIGYGRICDNAQRDVIRAWADEVGFTYQPITQ